MQKKDSFVLWKIIAIFCSVLWCAVVMVSTISCNKPLTEAEQDGKALYDMHCAQCHDENELGLKKVPPKLNGIFSRKTLPDGTTPATDAAVLEIIIKGKRTMPAFNGRLNEDQVSDLIAYLHKK